MASSSALSCFVISLSMAWLSSAAEQHTQQMAEWKASLGCRKDDLPDLDTRTALTWSLIGEGAHRHVRYLLHWPSLPCKAEQVHMAVPLPIELFSDPYQLQNMERMHDWLSFKVYGTVDLESPASHANVNTLSMTIAAPDSCDGRPPNCIADKREFDVPIHSRYALPSNDTGQDQDAWWSFLMSGYVDVVLPSPAIVVQCSTSSSSGDTSNIQASQAVCLFSPDESKAQAAVWRVPVGSLQHAEIVSFGTALSAVVACLAVLAVLFRDRLQRTTAVDKEE